MDKLPYYLIPIRDEIYKDAWEKYKSRPTSMKDLALIFKVDLPHLFIILKRYRQKQKNNN